MPSAQTFVDWIPLGRVCTQGSFGVLIVIMYLDRKMAIPYAMSKLDMTFLGSARTKTYVGAIYDALGAIWA